MVKEKFISNFLEQIHAIISEFSYNTWFKSLQIVKFDEQNDKISFLDPGELIKKHILANYKDIIDETIINITGREMDIEFVDELEILDDPLTDTIPIDTNINKNYDINNTFETGLNKDFTFDNFVVGEANKFAVQSALAVAQNPGKIWNPLFIYGKSGLGKTHLMQAIGNYIVNNSNLKVLYTDAETFIGDFVGLSKNSNDKEQNFAYIEAFKKKYREIDVLLIDEIQFLGKATASQQEFTNTFNFLKNNNKQIVICSDKSIDDLKLFEERLKTRFSWGLKAIIDPPEHDLKVKIIRSKIENEFNVELSDDIIEYVASNTASNVRAIEGCLKRLMFMSLLMHKTLDLNEAIDALAEEIHGPSIYVENSIEKVMAVVANYFNISVDDLKGKKRTKVIATARMVAMYFCRILTEETLQRIGLYFGGRDHTTVIHGYEKIDKDIKTNNELKKIVDEISIKMGE